MRRLRIIVTEKTRPLLFNYYLSLAVNSLNNYEAFELLKRCSYMIASTMALDRKGSMGILTSSYPIFVILDVLSGVY
jgi:hypothetical protein